MALNSLPTVEAGASNNNRVYRATQSGTYTADIKPGVYRVTRQATTNIIIGSTTITPGSTPTIVFINTPQTQITFNSTISQDNTPWYNGGINYGTSSGLVSRVQFDEFTNNFVAFGQQNNRVIGLSTDGLTWAGFTHAGFTITTSWYMTEMVRGTSTQVVSGIWMTNGSTPTLVWSTDTRWWSQTRISSVPSARGLLTAQYANGLYVLGGLDSTTNGILYWSTDPTNPNGWGTATLLVNEYFLSSAYGDGKFVFVGTAGSIRYSTNGTTWSVTNSTFGAQPIRRVIYAQNKFVAAGDSGIISVSTDGITWQNSNSGFSSVSITDLIYSTEENVFVATAANNGIIRISTDAITWVPRSLPTAFIPGSLAYGRGYYCFRTWNFSDSSVGTTFVVSNILITTPTVPFTDTYIMLDFKGQIETLI